MKPAKPSAELAARIQARIDALGGDSGGEWGSGTWPVRECRDVLNALPVHGSQTYLWALRPDGTVLCLDHESFRHETEPESDPQRRYVAVAQGARRYPELQELVPTLRVAFLMARGRSYRTSEVSRELLEEAVRERRVLLIHGGARAFASGDVWFTVARPEDLNAQHPLDGLIEREPIADDDVPERNVFDSTWEYWGYHNEGEITQPCQQMLPRQRVRFKQAVALLSASLLDTLPPPVAAGVAPYRELLRLYARAPDHRLGELAERAAACGRGTGCQRLVFDPERAWETDAKVHPVLAFTDDMPRALGEWLRSDVIERKGVFRYVDAYPAEAWLRETARSWITDAAWEIQAGGGIPDVCQTAESVQPGFFSRYRLPPPPEQERLVRALLAGMSERQASDFRRQGISLLARKLQSLPGVSEPLTTLLDAAREWVRERKPEIEAKADALAEEAARLGGNDAPFGLPFRLIGVRDPSEVAVAMVEAARGMAVARFRTWTRGLETDMPEGAERKAGEAAAEAELEKLRRRAHSLMLETEGR